MKKLLKVAEVAKLLDLNTSRIYDLVRENRMPHIRIGVRQIRFSEDQLEAWIDNNCEMTNERRADVEMLSAKTLEM